MRINAHRTFWGVRKKSLTELVAYLNLKNNQKISSLKQRLEEIKSENLWLKERLDLLSKSDSNTFPPERKSAFIERVKKIEKRALPSEQKDDFMPNLKKTLFGLHRKQVNKHIKKLKMYQSEERKEVREQLDRLITLQNDLLNEIRLHSEKIEEEKSAKQLPSEAQRAKPIQDQKVETESVKQSIQQSTKRSAKQPAELNTQRTMQTAEHQHEQQAERAEQNEHVLHERPVERGGNVLHEQPAERDGNVLHVPLKNSVLIKQQVPESTRKPKRLTLEVSSFWEEDIEPFLSGLCEGSMVEREQWMHVYSDDPSQPGAPKVDGERQNVVLRQPAENRKSPAISDQGAYLRRKYIVGKIVGKDLKDDRGKLIARQDTEITELVLITAEQEGKLAELIVAMKLQQGD